MCLNGKQAASTGLAPFFLSYGYDIEVVSIEDDDVDARTKSATTPRAIANVTVAKLRDAYEWAQAAMAAAQQNQEDQANKRRSTPSTYKRGDKVWLHLKNFTTNRPCKKLDWLHGKYAITRAFPNSHVFELDVPRNVHKKFHTSLLRPAATDPLPSQQLDDSQPPRILNDVGDEKWQVEQILRAKWVRVGRGRRCRVLVKWVSFAEPTW